jgi:hypothetical protein
LDSLVFLTAVDEERKDDRRIGSGDGRVWSWDGKERKTIGGGK